MRAPNPLFNAQQSIMNKLATQQNLRENSARLAHCLSSATTSGWGEFNLGDAITFDSPYLYRPSFSYGASLLNDDEAAKLRSTRYPSCTGAVIHWDVRPDGMYYGAWVLVRVEDRSALVTPTIPDPDPNYTIVHDFTFLGIALKNIPTHLAGDEAEV